MTDVAIQTTSCVLTPERERRGRRVTTHIVIDIRPLPPLATARITQGLIRHNNRNVRLSRKFQIPQSPHVSCAGGFLERLVIQMVNAVKIISLRSVVCATGRGTGRPAPTGVLLLLRPLAQDYALALATTH